MAATVDPATRKRVLRGIALSLLLDLISFTFYRDSEAPALLTPSSMAARRPYCSEISRYSFS
ncbi:uncharacterized protein BBA_00711 [Beauveria bassiana ARSEF 2860]|uniref:Uncharacterized protein n=1 Tax=Beauveria bassiana (strain ARSEF 2860) TaxID=655819 RepID=J4UUW9_BEAB2|nr:uncharacterized protein BBA_00711 [Beauveria bassiana ARSEF 2860]EJP69842.1 hypothetical protein BBA_00711 [Beauveria bassiana ARSEF 2860]